MNFNLEIFGQFDSFLGYQTYQQIVHKIAKFHSHFQLKSEQELKVKLAIFSKKLIQKSQNSYQKTKINQQLLVLIDFMIKSLLRKVTTLILLVLSN